MGLCALNARRTASCSKTGSAPVHGSAEQRKEAALRHLAISIFHDLRNPLSAIRSGAEMLAETELPDHQVRRVARNICKASGRIQELLQDYFDLCRAGETRLRACDLRTLVVHSVEKLATLAEAQSVSILEEIPPGLLIHMDRRRISSVMANLLTNALEAMPSGGSIHISAREVEASVVTRVRDTGPGVPPEIRERLFERFATARKAEGWGLGLAHARQVVREHGGEMWLEDAPGAGACFAFSLPVL